MGLGGADQLAGGSGNDKLEGGIGNDKLDGGAGDDQMAGGVGNDFYIVDSAKDKISETLTLANGGGVDEVFAYVDFSLKSLANVENMTLLGAKNLNAIGNAGVNILIGNAGHNRLDGDKGNDILKGGAGNDTYVIDSLLDKVDEESNADSGDTIVIAAILGTQVKDAAAYAGIENFLYAGSAAWTFTGDLFANRITGGSGTDTLFGGDGDDYLIGGAGLDVLHGGNDDDILDGGKGNDDMHGDAGDDLYLVDSLGDRADEEGNTDILDIVRSSISLTINSNFSGIDRFELAGNAALSLTGDKSANVLIGNSAANILAGGDGNDRIEGGAGNDDINGGDDDDQLFGDSGNDILNGGKGNDVIDGGSGVDIVILSGKKSDFTIQQTGIGSYVVTDNNTKGNNNQGSDTLTHVEVLRFNDGDISGPSVILDINPVANSVVEGAAAGTLAGVTVSASDPLNGISAKVFFNLVEDAGGRFVLDANGNLRVGDARAIDYEAAKSATIVIRATVNSPGALNDGLYTEQSFTIAIIDDLNKTLAAIDAEALAPSRGFRLDGGAEDNGAGGALAGGDLDGDGFADLVIGAHYADRNGYSDTGGAYVVFGKAAGFGAGFDLAALDGKAGFRIDGLSVGDRLGAASAIGDLNGDGFADLVLGAPSAALYAGAVYIVFGRGDGFAPVLDLTALDGTNGLRLDGAAMGDQAGAALAIGDLNGDGIGDLAIGASGANGNAGSVAILFGKGDWSAAPNLTLDNTLLDGKSGFLFDGQSGGDRVGSTLDLGDVNGDGFADLLTGAPYVGLYPHYGAGYVLFGKSDWGGSPNLNPASLNGASGFTIKNSFYSLLGQSIAAIGDINGDGIGDLGIAESSVYNGYSYSAVYVVFGTATASSPTLDLLTMSGQAGFRLSNPFSPAVNYSLSAAGDINGDGIGDLLIGAPRGDNGLRSDGGASYIVFGRAAGFASVIDLSQLNGTDGFRILGSAADDYSGAAVAAAGDLNGDGFDDLAIGAPGSDPDGSADVGAAYILYGGNFTNAATKIGTAKNDTMKGSAAADGFFGGLGNDVLFGKGGADLLNGGAGEDSLHVTDLNFHHVDGGSGRDAFEYDAAGHLDLGVIVDRLSEIEILDLDNGLANDLLLGLADVIALSPIARDFADDASLDNLLVIEGDLADRLTLAMADGWGVADLAAAPGYAIYAVNNWRIVVDSDIQVSLI